MMHLTARYADGWNWWSAGPPDIDELRGMLDELDRHCSTVGRNPATLSRSLDLYSARPAGHRTGVGPGDLRQCGRDRRQAAQPCTQLGFSEIRCNVVPAADAVERLRAIGALGAVAEVVHQTSPTGVA